MHSMSLWTSYQDKGMGQPKEEWRDYGPNQPFALRCGNVRQYIQMSKGALAEFLELSKEYWIDGDKMRKYLYKAISEWDEGTLQMGIVVEVTSDGVSLNSWTAAYGHKTYRRTQNWYKWPSFDQNQIIIKFWISREGDANQGAKVFDALMHSLHSHADTHGEPQEKDKHVGY